MVQEAESISTALLQTLQGLFADEGTSHAGRGSPVSSTVAAQGVSLLRPLALSEGRHQPKEAAPVSPWSVDELSWGCGASTASNILALQQRRDELRRRLEKGPQSLQADNEALESQVLHMQEDFVALQNEFKDLKEGFSKELGDLDRQLEDQQAVTSAATKRVICTEDLIRFFEEQRRFMASHWKAQCQPKDEHIRSLNLQLTEYTTDSSMMKQTDASLSHELHCLQDRHGELRSEHLRRLQQCDELAQDLAEAREAEAAESCEAEATASAHGSLCQLEAQGAGLRSQLHLLEDRRRSSQTEDVHPETTWSHTCIWRDELDIRESQLEKITLQLDRTNDALQAAQAALASQRLRHEEMKRQHRDAECQLRENERLHVRWRRECTYMRRAKAELARDTDLQFAHEQRGT